MSDETPRYDPNNSYPTPANQPWPPPPGVTPYPPGAPAVNGQMILIFGILGVTIMHILAPFAWYLGNQALATLDRYGDPLLQRGSVNTGRICGIIGTILMGVGLLFVILYFVVIIGIIGVAATSGAH